MRQKKMLSYHQEEYSHGKESEDLRSLGYWGAWQYLQAELTSAVDLVDLTGFCGRFGLFHFPPLVIIFALSDCHYNMDDGNPTLSMKLKHATTFVVEYCFS